MNITMESANITMDGYVSPEVKAQQNFKYYNNSNMYVTFRAEALKDHTVKELAETVVKAELLKHSDEINMTNFNVSKLYQTYAVF